VLLVVVVIAAVWAVSSLFTSEPNSSHSDERYDALMDARMTDKCASPHERRGVADAHPDQYEGCL